MIFLSLCCILTGSALSAQDRATIRFAETGNAVNRFCYDSENGEATRRVEVVASAGGCSGYVINWGDGTTTAVTGTGERTYARVYNLNNFRNNRAAGLLEYNIIITSTDENCIDINVARLLIHKIPIAEPTVTAACEDKNSTFTNTSAGRNGQAQYLTWEWEFSDGRKFFTQNLGGLQFADPNADHWVTLSVRSSLCNSSSTSERKPFNLKKLPVTDATVSGLGEGVLCFTDNSDSTITLDASASSETTLFNWRILGGGYEIDELIEPDSSVMRVKMLNSANYTIAFTARNECGDASNTFNAQFEALPLPEISLVPQPDGCEEVNYKVLNSREGAVYTLNGAVFNAAEEMLLTVSDEPYIVRGEVSNACGMRWAADTFYVHTREQVRITSLPADTTVCMATNPLSLTASRPGGEWTGEGILAQNDGRFIFLPNQAGDFNISYSVGTGLCLSSATHRVGVLNELAEPQIGIDGLDTRCSPSQVLFSNRSVGHEHGFSLWNFGDGTAEREVREDTVSHVFQAVGDEAVYSVRLTVRNVCGQASVSRRIRIIPNTIAPLFEVSGEQVCPNEPIQFTDATVPLPSNWVWSFGGQQQSNIQNPEYAFDQPGTYRVTLVSTNQCATDSVSRTITVVAPPTPQFAVDSDRLCEGESVSFTNQTDPKYSFRWDFGDGTTPNTTSLEPSHTYATDGVYTVKLTIFDGSEFCAASADVPVQILPVIDTRFAVEVDELACEPALVKFVNHTEQADTWHWVFSDGVTTRESTVKEPLIPFTSGQYTFQLTASREGACSFEAADSRYFDFTDCVVEIPEAFTPNGDLHGDRYTLFGNGIDQIIFLKIRNRWSEVVYEMQNVPAGSQSAGESWDGTKGGRPLPADMYVFEAKVRYRDQTESEVIRGNFYLVR